MPHQHTSVTKECNNCITIYILQHSLVSPYLHRLAVPIGQDLDRPLLVVTVDEQHFGQLVHQVDAPVEGVLTVLVAGLADQGRHHLEVDRGQQPEDPVELVQVLLKALQLASEGPHPGGVWGLLALMGCQWRGMLVITGVWLAMEELLFVPTSGVFVFILLSRTPSSRAAARRY